MDAVSFSSARSALVEDGTLGGRAWCAAYTWLVDDWLAQLFADAVDGTERGAEGVVLVAVGGYGREASARSPTSTFSSCTTGALTSPRSRTGSGIRCGTRDSSSVTRCAPCARR